MDPKARLHKNWLGRDKIDDPTQR